MAICQQLLNSSYAQDPNAFGIPQQNGYLKPTTTGSTTTLVPQNVSWSFTCAAGGNAAPPANAGITSSASDLTPLVYFNNGFSTAITGIFPASPGTAKNITIGATAPFGQDGIAVFYKGNNAVYLKSGTAGQPIGTVVGFVSANDTDTTTYSVAP
ncbi:MAG: hypothetical protein WDO13_10870 [Verrucomicrobiota bacterium]